MYQILVVEDDKNTRRLMSAVLTRTGYEPIMAENGEEALEILDRKHIDLIVLDVMMPRMDGYELTNTLRSNGCTLPILMVTARETQEALSSERTTTWSSRWTRRRWYCASPHYCAAPRLPGNAS